MKVIFLKDVPNLAGTGDIKEVADGYGRNFLIPKKLAVLANPGVASRLEAQRHAQAKIETESANIANQLNGKEVILKVKVGSRDRLYGSVTSADIAAELKSTSGVVINKRKIELAKPIRHLGSYDVAIRLAKDIMPKIKVTVTEKETD